MLFIKECFWDNVFSLLYNKHQIKTFAVSFSEASKPNLGEQNQMLITSTLTCRLHRSMISDLVNYYLL